MANDPMLELVLDANARGAAAFARGDHHEALEAFEEASMLLTPDHDHLANDVYENVGLVCYTLGRPHAAARAFVRALDGDWGSRQQSLQLLIPCLLGTGALMEAKRALQDYVGAFGPHPDVSVEALEEAIAESRRRGRRGGSR